MPQNKKDLSTIKGFYHNNPFSIYHDGFQRGFANKLDNFFLVKG